MRKTVSSVAKSLYSVRSVPMPVVVGAAGGCRSYHDIIIDHYENPRNVGSLDKNKINVGTGKENLVISVRGCFYRLCRLSRSSCLR